VTPKAELEAVADQEIADVSCPEGMREVAHSAIVRALEYRQLLLDAHQQLLDRDAELALVAPLVQEPQMRKLADELAECRRRIDELESTVHERTDWAQRLDRELSERTDWAQRLDRELSERTDWAQRLDLDLTERNELIDQLQRMVEQRTEWAEMLQQELAERRTRWLPTYIRDALLRLRTARGRREIRRV
jgi:predicted RNase H-like nuclease (RuvC/YqgF family)